MAEDGADVHRSVGDLIARYCRLWDDRRYDEWIDLFEADAEFDWRGHGATGRDAIQRMIGAGNTARPDGPGMHVMSNTIVTAASDGARAVSDFVFIGLEGDRHQVLFAGRTYDELRPSPDGWRFARRIVRFLGDDPPDGWSTV